MSLHEQSLQKRVSAMLEVIVSVAHIPRDGYAFECIIGPRRVATARAYAFDATPIDRYRIQVTAIELVVFTYDDEGMSRRGQTLPPIIIRASPVSLVAAGWALVDTVETARKRCSVIAEVR